MIYFTQQFATGSKRACNVTVTVISEVHCMFCYCNTTWHYVLSSRRHCHENTVFALSTRIQSNVCLFCCRSIVNFFQYIPETEIRPDEVIQWKYDQLPSADALSYADLNMVPRAIAHEEAVLVHNVRDQLPFGYEESMFELHKEATRSPGGVGINWGLRRADDRY